MKSSTFFRQFNVYHGQHKSHVQDSSKMVLNFMQL